MVVIKDFLSENMEGYYEDGVYVTEVNETTGKWELVDVYEDEELKEFKKAKAKEQKRKEDAEKEY